MNKRTICWAYTQLKPSSLEAINPWQRYKYSLHKSCDKEEDIKIIPRLKGLYINQLPEDVHETKILIIYG